MLTAGLLANLDVGAVHGADDEAAVHNELHVRGAAGLRASRGDVLRRVRGGDDLLGHGHAVVGQEGKLQVGAHVGVGVDDIRHVVDELDDGLRAVVARRRLAANAREALLDLGAVHRGHGLDLQVPVDLVAHIHHLALVLVDALHLHVDQARRVHVEVAMLLNPSDEAHLAALLGRGPLLLEGLVVLELADAPDEGEVLEPSVAAELLRDEL
mmetsp:Transcript_9956/g.31632  ORF Transcript_9956/g.31632 Transcript_9956/m.31632 type:complete len:212 (-) Transcript_9956:1700-2335(-)